MLKLEDAKKELHDEMQNRIDYANFTKHYHAEKEQFFEPAVRLSADK